MTDAELEHQRQQIQRMMDYYQRSDGKLYQVIVVDPEETPDGRTEEA